MEYRGLTKEELEKRMEKYTVNAKSELDDDIFQEVVKTLAKERKKIEKKKGKKNGKRAKSDTAST